jgi:carboxyl-terminal processing protease
MRLFAFALGIAIGFNSMLLSRGATVNGEPENTLLSLRHTNATALIEGPNDTNIVKLVAEILQTQHYLRLPLDNELSSRFFERYLDSLDNLHIYFTQADLRQFEKYRLQLDDFSLKRGDAEPAREIFNRFRERLEQQFEFVQNALANEKFTFTGNDRFILDRKKLPRPADLAEAKKTLDGTPPLRVPPGKAQQGKNAGDRQEPYPPLYPNPAHS